MSSVDSGINSLSTVVVNDWIRPARKAGRAKQDDVALARYLTVGFGLLATVSAVYAAHIGDIVKTWMNIMGLFAGPRFWNIAWSDDGRFVAVLDELGPIYILAAAAN